MTKHQTSTPALRGAAHLLTSVPYLLGYTPESSIVLIAGRLPRRGRSGSAVEVTLRVDLPSSPETVAPMVAQIVEPMAQLVRRDHADGFSLDHSGMERWLGGQTRPALLAHVFLYDADDDLAAEILRQCRSILPTVGVAAHEVHVVRGGTHLPLITAGEVCPVVGEDGDVEHAPGDWRDLPSPEDVPAIADWVLKGRNPGRRRGDVVDLVRRRDERAAGVTQLAEDILALDMSRLDEEAALAALGRWVTQGEAPSPKVRAAIGVTLTDRATRDLVLSRWVPELFPPRQMALRAGDEALQDAVPALVPGSEEQAVTRLVELSSMLPEGRTASLLTIAGCVAWWNGQGTLANETIALALEREPGYALAMLFDVALSKGVNPRVMAAAARAA
ncbi:DUF4192 family protein [Ornithinimicrobium panacihumi]|uniref:DUF4192 family protein n=1 Tax=Ornithinimicrobium panacihumi TaxID=2008449 RepID=UPI003F8CD7BA